MFLTPTNIYNYRFPTIVDNLLQDVAKHRQLEMVGRKYGFVKEKVTVKTSIWPVPYDRYIWRNLELGLIMKMPHIWGGDPISLLKAYPNFKYICPTAFVFNKKGAAVLAQPIGICGPLEDQKAWSARWKKEIYGFDTNSQNVVFLKGLPALIDW